MDEIQETSSVVLWFHLHIYLFISLQFSYIEQVFWYDKQHNWPASREKGPSDITNRVDPDQPLHDIENIYT